MLTVAAAVRNAQYLTYSIYTFMHCLCVSAWIPIKFIIEVGKYHLSNVGNLILLGIAAHSFEFLYILIIFSCYLRLLTCECMHELETKIRGSFLVFIYFHFSIAGFVYWLIIKKTQTLYTNRAKRVRLNENHIFSTRTTLLILFSS